MSSSRLAIAALTLTLLPAQTAGAHWNDLHPHEQQAFHCAAQHWEILGHYRDRLDTPLDVWNFHQDRYGRCEQVLARANYALHFERPFLRKRDRRLRPGEVARHGELHYRLGLVRCLYYCDRLARRGGS